MCVAAGLTTTRGCLFGFFARNQHTQGREALFDDQAGASDEAACLVALDILGVGDEAVLLGLGFPFFLV